MSAEKTELGRRLFYDADLSIDGTMSCATCHEQHRAFADGNATHSGVHGDPGRRNVPGLANVAWMKVLTWGNPKIQSLERQAAVPITGKKPVEMGMAGHENEIARRLGKDSCYRTMFARAFPGETAIDFAQVAKALAAFERTLVSLDTPYDAWRRGNRAVLSPDAQRGASLFAHDCSACHSGLLLSDGKYHRVVASSASDPGLGEITGRLADVGRFRTPSLRNVALTGPYLHDGSAKTVVDAVRRHPRTATLSASKMDSLSAFMNALTDYRLVKDERFSLPTEACGKRL
ncbi:cytochrome-c peroxidase [Sphingomonas paeninsulae]|nr:cytochrome-c peroxidase [Sphingomonas paeninsulae]